MNRIFEKMTRLYLGAVLVFISSCTLNKSYDQALMSESLIYGRAGKFIENVYFEVEIDLTNALSKQRKIGSSDTTASIKNGGFTPGSCYNLYVTKIDDSTWDLGRIIANQEGELIMCSMNSILLKNYVVSHFGCMRGEEIYYTLVSDDGSTYLTTSTGSDLIRAKAEDGADLAIKLRSPNVDLFSIEGKGFISGEKLELTNSYSNQKIETSVIVGENGYWLSVFKIDLKKHMGETGSFTVKRQNGEILHADYLWGPNSFKMIKK